MLFSEAANKFMNYQEVTTSEGNFRYLTSKMAILHAFFDDMPVTMIDENTIIDFIKEQRLRNPELSNSSMNKYISLLRRVLKEQAGLIVEFQKLRENKPSIEIVPKKLVDRIFKHYEAHLSNRHNLRNYIMFRVLLETGLRINELLNLRVSDVNTDMRTIHVRITKTKEERYVFISEKTVGLLQVYVYKYLINGYIFQNVDGSKLDYKALNKSIERLKRRLKIKQSISPHKWRHTFATNYIAKGGDTASLQKLLGHRNLSTTEKYLHLSVDILRKRYEEIMQNSDF
jgi:site-specific recombinase XerD